MSDSSNVVNRRPKKEDEEQNTDGKEDTNHSKDATENKSSGDHATNSNKTEVFTNFIQSVGHSLMGAANESCRTSVSPLKSMNLEGIADYIKTQKPKNIIVMTGAGISTGAGIPDFRTPGTGLYSNLAEYGLDDPQDIFDLDFFNETPEPFFKLAKALFPKDIKPTPAHYFVRLLERKGLLLRWFTQNIDSLEIRAGVSKDKVMAAHGSHASSTCLKCKKKYDLAWITKFLDDPDTLVPHCEGDGCDGVVKSDIIFFSESLPRDFFVKIVQDFPCADLLIVMGTSLVVQPFASLVDEVDTEVPRLLINKEPAGPFRSSMSSSRHISPLDVCQGIRQQCNRDVFWRGDCNEGCLQLAELLGWDAELEQLIAQGPPTASLL